MSETGRDIADPSQAAWPAPAVTIRAPEAIRKIEGGLSGSAGSSASKSASEPATGERLGHGEGRQILVIEDEPNISEALRFILRRDGWAVETYATGEGALERIMELRPVLVILDVMLPGQSGFDVLRDIRAAPELAGLPVLLLTARGQVPSRERAQELGASLFMPKPFANSELLAAVRQLLGV